MFSKKDLKKNIVKNDLENYNANNAHKEMVIKSGGGINNLLQKLEDANYIIELYNQKIARLNLEINNLESKLIELTITYKFKNRFFVIEVNKNLLFNKIQNNKFVKIYKYIKKVYIIEYFNKYYRLFTFKKTLKFFILLMNFLFLINNFNKII